MNVELLEYKMVLWIASSHQNASDSQTVNHIFSIFVIPNKVNPVQGVEAVFMGKHLSNNFLTETVYAKENIATLSNVTGLYIALC